MKGLAMSSVDCGVVGRRGKHSERRERSGCHTNTRMAIGERGLLVTQGNHGIDAGGTHQGGAKPWRGEEEMN